MNARALEHAITKLLSSDLPEERELGEDLKIKGREITPTLIKYADVNDYLVKTRDAQARHSFGLEDGASSEMDGPLPEVRLVHHDPQAEQKLAAALLYRYSGLPYQEVRDRVNAMGPEGRRGIIADCMEALGEHDAPVRELEMVDYTFEFIMDYGAYREFKRHRMQTYIPQPLTVADGYVTPELVREAGLAPQYDQAMERSAEAFRQVQQKVPPGCPVPGCPCPQEALPVQDGPEGVLPPVQPAHPTPGPLLDQGSGGASSAPGRGGPPPPVPVSQATEVPRLVGGAVSLTLALSPWERGLCNRGHGLHIGRGPFSLPGGGS